MQQQQNDYASYLQTGLRRTRKYSLDYLLAPVTMIIMFISQVETSDDHHQRCDVGMIRRGGGVQKKPIEMEIVSIRDIFCFTLNKCFSEL